MQLNAADPFDLERFVTAQAPVFHAMQYEEGGPRAAARRNEASLEARAVSRDDRGARPLHWCNLVEAFAHDCASFTGSLSGNAMATACRFKVGAVRIEKIVVIDSIAMSNFITTLLSASTRAAQRETAHHQKVALNSALLNASPRHQVHPALPALDLLRDARSAAGTIGDAALAERRRL
jgi:hypothetical protein